MAVPTPYDRAGGSAAFERLTETSSRKARAPARGPDAAPGVRRGAALPAGLTRAHAPASAGSRGTSSFFALMRTAALTRAASSNMPPQKNATW